MTARFALAITLLLNSGAAHSAAPVCFDIFAKPAIAQSQVDSSVSKPSTVQKSVIERASEIAFKPFEALRRLVEYNPEMITALKAEYVEQIKKGEMPDPVQLKDVNEKAALIDAIGAVHGRDIFNLNLWLAQAPPKLVQQFTKTLKTLNFENKTSWRKSEKALLKIYILTHFDPAAKPIWEKRTRSGWNALRFAQLLKSEWGNDVLELERYRLGISIARNGVLNGLIATGMVKDKTTRERIQLRLRKYNRPIDIVGSTIKSVISVRLPILQTRTPRVLMTAKDLDPVVEQRYITDGFDAVRNEVHALYGKSANVQLTLNRTEQVLGVIFTPIMVAVFFDDLKEFGKEIYTAITGDEIDRKKVSFKPTERKQLIDQTIENQRKLRIAATDPSPLPESEDEKSIRLETINEELSTYRSELDTLTDDELAISLGL